MIRISNANTENTLFDRTIPSASFKLKEKCPLLWTIFKKIKIKKGKREESSCLWINSSLHMEINSLCLNPHATRHRSWVLVHFKLTCKNNQTQQRRPDSILSTVKVLSAKLAYAHFAYLVSFFFFFWWICISGL